MAASYWRPQNVSWRARENHSATRWDRNLRLGMVTKLLSVQTIAKRNGQSGGRGLMMLLVQEIYTCPVNFGGSRLPLYERNVSRETGASNGPLIPEIDLSSVGRSRQSLGTAANSSAIDWAVADTANTPALATETRLLKSKAGCSECAPAKK